MDKKIVAREYISTTRCDAKDGGWWEAYNKVTDRVLYEGENEFLEETVEAKAMDTDSQNAIQTAMNSTLSYLIQNVYQNGFKGLIEYREFQRKLEASGGSSAKSN